MVKLLYVLTIKIIFSICPLLRVILPIWQIFIQQHPQDVYAWMYQEWFQRGLAFEILELMWNRFIFLVWGAGERIFDSLLFSIENTFLMGNLLNFWDFWIPWTF